MFPIKNIMTKDVVSVSPDSSIFEAMELLKKHEISGVPVVDSELKLKGILTEKDVLSILLNHDIKYKHTVADYMTTEIHIFSPEDSAISVCQFFIKNAIRRVPIVKDGKLVGIVSRRDIISLILEIKSKISDSRYD
jgi:CBS domain-containing protein